MLILSEAAVGTDGYLEVQAMMAEATSSKQSSGLSGVGPAFFNQLQTTSPVGRRSFFDQQQVPDNPLATLFLCTGPLIDIQCVVV